MFYYIKGIYALSGENFIVIDVGGVGYKIFTTSNFRSAEYKIGDEITMYTHAHIKEDIFDIYGFFHTDELFCFRLLLSVSGVGPKASLAILSELGAAGLASSVASSDQKTIMRAPGIGKKLAQRIILELKDKIDSDELAAAGFKDSSSVVYDTNGNELISALVTLGYTRHEAENAARSLKEENLSLEEQIKRCLKTLMR